MTKEILTQEYLKECLHYDPETGIFTWKRRPREHFRTEKASKMWHSRDYVKSPGNLTDQGYLRICLNYQSYKAHRLVFMYMTGNFPEKQIDHIDHNRLNNAWANLREADNLENHKNMRLKRSNSSGFNGVSWDGINSKWAVYITVNRKRKFLGYFCDLKDAANARKKADRKYGFHENHGGAV